MTAKRHDFRSLKELVWLPIISTLLILVPLARGTLLYDWNAIGSNFTDFDYDGNTSFANVSSVLLDDGGNHKKPSPTISPARGRVNCLNGNSEFCCPEPYLAITLQGVPNCCKPNSQPNEDNCCPKNFIPAREPNVDPSLEPLCCNFTTGECCLRDIIMKGIPEPKNGKCCLNDGNCCPRPLIPRGDQCCSHSRNNQPGIFCCRASWIFHWPTPRCCSQRGFCCPLPYNIRLFDPPVPPELYDSRCYGPKASCSLPLVPSYNSCVHQPIAFPMKRKDTPEYELSYPKYSHPDPKKTIFFAYPQCSRAQVIREIFGNKYYDSVQASSVPLNWHVTRISTQRMKQFVKNDTSLNKHLFSWPDAIIPFLFPLSIIALSIASIIPLILISAIGWAVVFNCRFLAHKRIKMAVRRLLIYLEKRRRNFQFRSLPRQYLKRVRQQDRYQMPKAFQDSDLSSDDEPAELHADKEEFHADDYRKRESLWTQEEIDKLGFDPDHIPLEWIYGDLLGKPEEVRPEVRNFNAKQRRTTGGGGETAADMNKNGLDSVEWHDFMSCRATDKGKRQGGKVVQKIRQTLRRMRSASRSHSRNSSSLRLAKTKSKKASKGKKRKKNR